MTGHSPIIESSLQVEGHLEPHEYEGLLKHWESLDHRLRSFDDRTIEMRLFVNERDTPNQHLNLDVKLAGRPPLVASSSAADIAVALREVRDDMVRQLGDAKNKTEPRNARNLRDTVRHR